MASRIRRAADGLPGLIPALVPTAFIVVAFLVPLAGLFVLSLRPTDGLNNPLPGLTFDQYAEVFATDYLWGSVVESLWLAVRVSVTCLVLALPVAWYLARSTSRVGKSIVFIVTLSPLLTSEVVRSFGWRVVMGGEGPVNVVLQAIGAIGEPLSLLRSPWTVFLAVVHVMLPFAIIALSASLGAIDVDVLRASAVLGASKARTFLSVVVPMAAPGIVAALVIVFSLSMGVYVTPMLVGGANQPLAGLRIQTAAMTTFDQPGAAALSFVLLVVTLVVCALLGGLGRLAEPGRLVGRRTHG
ncbi:ABC transporter permease [Microbacterium marinilacus]|uniref:ABC transporter permease n=1 Tax=Microbacterium marinilacus TaxID=415209 RepID=A0ABP7BKQ7_9MICO|nr:ABC transporter permease [Microbacterium marinilacus]MBY0689715.1 ABC transporter permease [Microbacterium marinilacus]